MQRAYASCDRRLAADEQYADAGIFASIEEIPSEQILILTDDKQLVSKIKDTKSTYALTNLS